MEEIGRILIAVGVGLGVIGTAILLIGRIPWVGRLPGDIIIQTENLSCLFPIATSILISIVLTVLLNLFLHFFR
jgi:hypothetical protein